MRPTASIQVPLLRSNFKKIVEHTKAHSPKARGLRGLRPRHLPINKYCDCAINCIYLQKSVTQYDTNVIIFINEHMQFNICVCE